MQNVEYDIGYVAFIDVLGWSDAINRSVDDAALRAGMATVQSSVRHRIVQQLDNRRTDRLSFNSNTFGYQLSDSIILAVPQREGTIAGQEFVATWCRLIARECFRAGFAGAGRCYDW